MLVRTPDKVPEKSPLKQAPCTVGQALIHIPFFGTLLAPDPVCQVALPKPWSASIISPELLVYTKNSNTKFRINDLSEISGKATELDSSGYFALGRQVVFIVHGFLNSHYFPWMDEMKNAIIAEEDSTVIIVSWGVGAVTPSYPQAGSNTQTVAMVVSSMAEAILNSATFKGMGGAELRRGGPKWAELQFLSL